MVKKILIATDTYYPSVNGAAYFTYRLAEGLAVKEDHRIFVIAPSRTKENTVSVHNGVTVYGIRSIGVPVYQNFRISPLILTRNSIMKAVKEIAPDVIHIQNHFMIGRGVAEAAWKLDIPIVGTNHFMPENLVHYFHLPKFAERRLKKFGWQQFLKVFEYLDVVTTPTETAAQLLRNIGLRKRVVTVSCGIDLTRFNPTNDGSYLRRLYKIPDDRPVLLYVGRMDKEKRIETVLRALQRILRSMDVHLILAGIGKQRIKLEIEATGMGIRNAVTFTDFVPDDDLPNLYTIADVFVNAGIAELQSIVTMEAMASGLPVVAVNAMALPELVKDGKNGFLFPIDDDLTLADRIITIFNDPILKKRMSANSLQSIQKHNINNSIQIFESLYRQAITEHQYKRP